MEDLEQWDFNVAISIEFTFHVSFFVCQVSRETDIEHALESETSNGERETETRIPAFTSRVR